MVIEAMELAGALTGLFVAYLIGVIVAYVVIARVTTVRRPFPMYPRFFGSSHLNAREIKSRFDIEWESVEYLDWWVVLILAVIFPVTAVLFGFKKLFELVTGV